MGSPKDHGDDQAPGNRIRQNNAVPKSATGRVALFRRAVRLMIANSGRF